MDGAMLMADWFIGTSIDIHLLRTQKLAGGDHQT
jgi:hypothetical protein